MEDKNLYVPPPLSIAALSQNIANPPTQFRSTKQANGPTRVILDRSLKTFLWETSNSPETLTILHPTENSTPPSAPTIIYHTSLPPYPNPSPKVSLKKLEGEDRIGRRIIDDLGENNEEDQTIMIEGGGNLARVFLEDGENKNMNWRESRNVRNANLHILAKHLVKQHSTRKTHVHSTNPSLPPTPQTL